MKSIITVCLAACFAVNAWAQDGTEIMRRVKDRPDGETRTVEVELKLINKRGDERVRKLKSYSKD